MSRGSVSASKEGGDLRGGSEALGGSLGEAINESVGPPIDGGEELAIAQLRHTDSFFRLVRRHPHEFSRVNNAGKVVADNVRHQVVGVMAGEDRATAPRVNNAVLEDNGSLAAELAERPPPAGPALAPCGAAREQLHAAEVSGCSRP